MNTKVQLDQVWPQYMRAEEHAPCYKTFGEGGGGGNLTFLPSPFQVPLCQASKSKRNIVNMGVNRGQKALFVKDKYQFKYIHIYKYINSSIHIIIAFQHCFIGICKFTKYIKNICSYSM